MKKNISLGIVAVSLMIVGSLRAADVTRPIITGSSLSAAQRSAHFNLFIAANRLDLEEVRAILLSDPSLINIQIDNFNPFVITTLYGMSMPYDRSISLDTYLKHTADDTQKRRDIVRTLLEAGAEVNLQNKLGDTALMIAAEQGDIVLVKMLLAYKADVHITNTKGKNALERAQKGYNSAIVTVLKNLTSIEKEEDTLMVKPAVDE